MVNFVRITSSDVLLITSRSQFSSAMWQGIIWKVNLHFCSTAIAVKVWKAKGVNNIQYYDDVRVYEDLPYVGDVRYTIKWWCKNLWWWSWCQPFWRSIWRDLTVYSMYTLEVFKTQIAKLNLNISKCVWILTKSNTAACTSYQIPLPVLISMQLLTYCNKQMKEREKNILLHNWLSHFLAYIWLYWSSSIYLEVMYFLTKGFVS